MTVDRGEIKRAGLTSRKPRTFFSELTTTIGASVSAISPTSAVAKPALLGFPTKPSPRILRLVDIAYRLLFERNRIIVLSCRTSAKKVFPTEQTRQCRGLVMEPILFSVIAVFDRLHAPSGIGHVRCDLLTRRLSGQSSTPNRAIPKNDGSIYRFDWHCTRT